MIAKYDRELFCDARELRSLEQKRLMRGFGGEWEEGRRVSRRVVLPRWIPRWNAWLLPYAAEYPT